ncbi:MAG: LCCL domain-containing protein [Pseudomonadota bacterium]
MKTSSIKEAQAAARKLGITGKHVGWIVAGALFIYFNTGLRAYAAEIEPTAAQLEWNTALKHFQVDSDKFIGQRFLFACPARTVRDEDRSVFGSDVYPSDSPICVAAVHAGAVTRSGGNVLVQLNPGAQSYVGSERNEVRSSDFPQTQRSIVFVDDSLAGIPDSVQRDYAPRLKWDTKFTSTGLANIKLVGQQFVFHCPAAPAKLAGRRVYGTDRYAFNSYVCLAAVHAGTMSSEGGFVTVQMEAPEGKLLGSIRHGIESKSGPAGTRQLIFPRFSPSIASVQ